MTRFVCNCGRKSHGFKSDSIRLTKVICLNCAKPLFLSRFRKKEERKAYFKRPERGYSKSKRKVRGKVGRFPVYQF